MKRKKTASTYVYVVAVDFMIIIGPTCMISGVGWTAFICFSWEMIRYKISLNSSFPFWYHISREPIQFLGRPKTSLEPLRTIFPWCPLGLHLCSGQCPFNQEKCLRRCGTEDRNGSLTLTQTAAPPPRWIKLANCSCWHYWSLSIGGGMIMLYSVLFQEREAVWVSRRRTVLFFSIHLLLNQLSNRYSTCYS